MLMALFQTLEGLTTVTAAQTFLRPAASVSLAWSDF